MSALRLHNSLTRQRENVRADRSVACPTVRVRPHGVRPGASGQRAAGGGVRRAGAAAAAAVSARDLCPQHHRRGRQDQRARGRMRASRSRAITARTTADFHADMAALGALPPDVEPRATEHIAEMIELIERLIAGGHAYAAEGHVLFSVASFPGVRPAVRPQPGRAARRRAGRRGAVQARRRRLRAVEAVDAGAAGLGQPVGPRPAGLAHRVQRDVLALSRRDVRHPWRRQRPDLPASRERAGAVLCAFPGSSFARLWLHNGMLHVDGEKMSKSLGNFFTVRDVLARAPARRCGCCCCARITGRRWISPTHGLAEARGSWTVSIAPWSARRQVRPMCRRRCWKRCATT